jgi:hypothetical protein
MCFHPMLSRVDAASIINGCNVVAASDKFATLLAPEENRLRDVPVSDVSQMRMCFSMVAYFTLQICWHIVNGVTRPQLRAAIQQVI